MSPSRKGGIFRDSQVGQLSEGTIWWGLYSLGRPVLSGEAGTIWWGRYYHVRPVLSGEAGIIWWGRYYLVRPVLSGKAGTICIAWSDNEYSLLIQVYLIKNHPRLKQIALKIIPTVWGLLNLGQQRTNKVESHRESKCVLPVRGRFSIHLYNAHSHTDLKVHTHVHTRKLLRHVLKICARCVHVLFAVMSLGRWNRWVESLSAGFY